MNTYTKKYTPKDIYLLNKYLGKFKKEINNDTIICIFKTKNYSITIYKNKTLLIQGKDYSNILKMIDPNVKCEDNKIGFKETLSTNLIGSDEVGTGDTFGGIVVCACYINQNNYELLKHLGIDDSKKIEDSKIVDLYNKIKDKITYSVVNLNPIEYNNLYKKYNNLNILKTYGHNLAINNILKKTKLTDFNCIIDQFTSIENYKKYLKNIDAKPNQKEIMVIKAESKYLVVAAASIIARYYFLKQMQDLTEKAKFEIPLGSQTKIITKAIKNMKTNNLDFSYFAKLHFKTIKEAK